jgi:superoxide dismutase, Cu-Zn family
MTEENMTMIRRTLVLAGTVIAIAVLLTGCTTLGGGRAEPARQAVAVVRPLRGSTVQGLVTFVQEDNGVRVVADITGLTPGKHGFHIHEFGDITATDGSSAGGHLNPELTVYGGPDDKDRHLGDLGNIEADRSGRARYNRVDATISLTGRNSIVGRAIVIKEGPDDFKTQPGGNAGLRIGMGVIGISATPIE